MKSLFLGAALLFAGAAMGQITLRYNDNQTLTYDQVIEAYRTLDKQHDEARLLEYGPTDSGRNLHVMLLASGPLPDEPDIHALKQGKTVILINNGIHPGESCGIDASLAFVADVMQAGVPENVLIAIIPVYNIGGALNRNCCTRANQNGPEMYGFRGNARNLDLNRDFIKADALNTLSFYSIFHQLSPHIFIDTHTSNGADYQYTMTLISTQKDKLNSVLADFLVNNMEPYLYSEMAKKNWSMIPYVNVFGSTPDRGYEAFLETPRYASGYTALFNTLGFVTEAHMFKPYRDRVEATRAFLHTITAFAGKNSREIQRRKLKAEEQDQLSESFAVNWKLDSADIKPLLFKGYAYEYTNSKVSGSKRLRYLRDQPQEYSIDYYHSYISTDTADVPEFYVVPRAWHEVPRLLQYNEVKMIPLERDTFLNVTSTYITSFDFAKVPYEGHFPLLQLSVEERSQNRQFLKGDYLVPTRQKNRRFIVSVLEPVAVDSYLRWNFYDEIFQQKEWFSPYVFEDTAMELLKANPELRTEFEAWKEQHQDQSQMDFDALYYLYRQTDAYEKEHLRYPVARIRQ